MLFVPLTHLGPLSRCNRWLGVQGGGAVLGAMDTPLWVDFIVRNVSVIEMKGCNCLLCYIFVTVLFRILYCVILYCIRRCNILQAICFSLYLLHYAYSILFLYLKCVCIHESINGNKLN